MSAPSQSYPQSYSATALPFAPLTITEVDVEPSPVLGKSKIYLYAAAGTAFGILLGVAVASSPSLPGWLAKMTGATAAESLTPGPEPRGQFAARGEEAAGSPRGPRDQGSVQAIAAGLSGRLATDWRDGARYRLSIEPADASLLPGFAMAVTSSPRPLSIGFELLDSAGAVLCGQNAVLRFDAARAAIENAGGDSGAIARLEAQELAREHGHDLFENVIGDNGQIAAIDVQGKMPCSQHALESAASWTFAADFPSVAEQAELLRGAGGPATAQSPAPAAKLSMGKKAETRETRASL